MSSRALATITTSSVLFVYYVIMHYNNNNDHLTALYLEQPAQELSDTMTHLHCTQIYRKHSQTFLLEASRYTFMV